MTTNSLSDTAALHALLSETAQTLQNRSNDAISSKMLSRKLSGKTCSSLRNMPHACPLLLSHLLSKPFTISTFASSKQLGWLSPIPAERSVSLWAL